MDQLRALQAFARVVEVGSFTRAAESLNLPKASVTTLVQQLEAHLGTKLLARTTRRLSLTDDGAAYLDGARRVLADLAELDAQVTGSTQAPKGRLRVDVPAAAGRHVLAPALPEFCARYPGIAVELGSSDRPVDLVLEGVDCVIRGGSVFDETLVARKLGTFEVITCAAPSYLARHGTPKTLADLQSGATGATPHQAVNFFSAKTGRVFPLDFADQQISLPHRVAANDADTHVALALAGLGIAQLPLTRWLQTLLAQGQLVRLLPEHSAGEMPLYVMYPRNRHLAARVRVFVDWVVALYAAKFESLAHAS